jgi:hypothetical protein
MKPELNLVGMGGGVDCGADVAGLIVIFAQLVK